MGASRFQQIQDSFARFARVIRLARLVDFYLSLVSIGCIAVGLVHASRLFVVAQVLSLSFLAGEVSYFFRQCWRIFYGVSVLGQNASSHRWFRRGKALHNATSGLGEDLCPAPC